MNNDEKRREEPEVVFESITLSQYIDEVGWDVFLSRQYTEETLKKEIYDFFLGFMRSYYAGAFPLEYALRYEGFQTFAGACEKYKLHQMSKADFLTIKDEYLTKISEDTYYYRLRHDPFCMRLRSELGIPDPYLMR